MSSAIHNFFFLFIKIINSFSQNIIFLYINKKKKKNMKNEFESRLFTLMLKVFLG